ncbi:MAG: signal recognition particle protein [Clostridia bacterium]|nr:signal recognition particle protein [Clostridia bacterium]
MMFDSLSDKLQNVMKKLKGQTRISEKELKEMLREVKLALLEADVNYKVVKDFVASIETKALGEDVMKSLTPGQQVVKIVRDELTELLGDTNSGLNFSSNPPTIIMLVGLQGSGKTTLCGKLSNYLRKQGKKPLMVACDVYRPAAIKQLETLGKSLNVDVYSEPDNKDVVEIAKNGIKTAISKLCNVVLVDTAGRLQIDETLMDELVDLKKAIRPHEIMLVIDSMVGQEAVNVAQTFNDKLGIDSVTMSKLDSDSRGGAALSVKSITKKPIKFASVGEKLSDLEPFYPDRIASRILGMGDVLSIIDKAEEAYEEEEAIELEKKIRKNEFTLDDYLEQMKKIRKMGSFKQLLAMIPGIPKEIKDIDIDEKQLLRIDAIITSMTKEERRNPKILNASRRQRIAKGSGNKVQDINRFIEQFTEMQKMMKNMMNGNGKYPKLPGNMNNLFK